MTDPDKHDWITDDEIFIMPVPVEEDPAVYEDRKFILWQCNRCMYRLALTPGQIPAPDRPITGFTNKRRVKMTCKEAAVYYVLNT